MRDKELYTQILGVQSPWQVTDVELLTEVSEVKVYVEPETGATFTLQLHKLNTINEKYTANKE